MNPTTHLTVGRVGRAVGLKGEVEVAVESDEPSRFAPGSTLLVGGSLRTLTIRRVRTHRSRSVVSFEELIDRTAAEELKGAELVIPIDRARSLDADEYWDHDLVGCAVVTTDGETVGRVTDVLHQPANDVLVVEGSKGENLIPLIRDVVRRVEPGSRITIEPIPGLLDDPPLA